MSRFRDHWAPSVAGAVVIAVAVSVVLLLDNAGDDGVAALTRAKSEQVQATADSFNARVASSLSSAANLGSTPWQLTPNSAADKKILETYDLDPNASSGFYLVDGNGVVTDGVLLEPGSVGRAALPGRWADIVARLARESAIVLPVANDSLTTELPTYRYVVAIRGSDPTSVRGAFVSETAVTANSAFAKEIRQLADPSASTAAWFFLDSRGSVVATSLDSGLGRPAENRRYRTMGSGVSHVDGRIVVAADVPSIGWRVVFRESESQFESALSGPLQKAGLILVLLLLAVGLTMIVVLVRRLRDAREQQRRLSELTRSQAEFISVVSHELRTPVAGILGFLQTTVDHWSALPDTDRLSTVRRAAVNARRLQAMTRDVLDAESIEAGRFGYAMDRVDLADELRQAIDISNDVDAARPVVLTRDGAGPVLVDADADRLQQMLGNLLENARKNAPAEEPITVSLSTTERTARITVRDTGPGIDHDQAQRIFDKFVRGNDNAVTGTGLGLYIARTIVTAHGGRIWCDTEPGRGTSFVVELSLAQPALAEPVPAGV